MQRLEGSGAIRPLYSPLGVKRLISIPINPVLLNMALCSQQSPQLHIFKILCGVQVKAVTVRVTNCPPLRAIALPTSAISTLCRMSSLSCSNVGLYTEPVNTIKLQTFCLLLQAVIFICLGCRVKSTYP